MLLTERETEFDKWFGPLQTYKVLFSVIDGKKSYDEYKGYELLHEDKSLPQVFVYQPGGVSFLYGPNFWTAAYLETGEPIPSTSSAIRSQCAIRALQQLEGKLNVRSKKRQTGRRE